MNRDFTFAVYKELIYAILEKGYSFITFLQFIMQGHHKKFVILRHDVERTIENALSIAMMEKFLGIRSTFYFRYNKKIFDMTIIKKIKNLGHEIGYHYETLAKARGDYPKAIEMFKYELNRLKDINDIKTVCAHGSPLSKWDSRKIWERYDFKEFGILGEPNFTLNFNKVLYLTDTGRRWNGESVSVRDKVNSKFDYSFKSTFDVIRALNNNELPPKLMINVHPHRWTKKLIPWLTELFWQNTKNIGKHILLIKVNR